MRKEKPSQREPSDLEKELMGARLVSQKTHEALLEALRSLDLRRKEANSKFITVPACSTER